MSLVGNVRLIIQIVLKLCSNIIVLQFVQLMLCLKTGCLAPVCNLLKILAINPWAAKIA